MISSVNPNDPSLLTSLQRDDTSVLDLVRDQAKDLRKKGSSGDRVRLDEYFESVRSVEQRLEASLRPQKRWINQGKFPLERPGPGIPATHPEHMRLMMDIMVLALWSDTTRIGDVHDGRRADQRGLLVPARRARAASTPSRTTPKSPSRKKQYEKMRHLARGAGGLFPEPAEEPG